MAEVYRSREQLPLEQFLLPLSLPTGKSDQVADVLSMLSKYLCNAIQSKTTARLTLEVELRDGGICDKFVTMRTREK